MGENHQVTVGFNDVKDKLAPVSAVVGLATFNSAETGEQLAYIGDTLVDWFYEGKVMGVQVDSRKDSIILCNTCAKLCDISDNICFGCNVLC